MPLALANRSVVDSISKVAAVNHPSLPWEVALPVTFEYASILECEAALPITLPILDVAIVDTTRELSPLHKLANVWLVCEPLPTEAMPINIPRIAAIALALALLDSAIIIPSLEVWAMGHLALKRFVPLPKSEELSTC